MRTVIVVCITSFMNYNNSTGTFFTILFFFNLFIKFPYTFGKKTTSLRRWCSRLLPKYEVYWCGFLTKSPGKRNINSSKISPITVVRLEIRSLQISWLGGQNDLIVLAFLSWLGELCVLKLQAQGHLEASETEVRHSKTGWVIDQFVCSSN